MKDNNKKKLPQHALSPTRQSQSDNSRHVPSFVPLMCNNKILGIPIMVNLSIYGSLNKIEVLYKCFFFKGYFCLIVVEKNIFVEMNVLFVFYWKSRFNISILSMIKMLLLQF